MGFSIMFKQGTLVAQRYSHDINFYAGTDEEIRRVEILGSVEPTDLLAIRVLTRD